MKLPHEPLEAATQRGLTFLLELFIVLPEPLKERPAQLTVNVLVRLEVSYLPTEVLPARTSLEDVLWSQPF